MSELLVRVVKIDEIVPHPNADKLEIVKLGGWQIISGKGNYKAGDLAVHVPPDAMVPLQLAKSWEVDKYLAFGKRSPDVGRVRAARLRGYPSYGFLAPNDTAAPLDADLAAHYGITKYEPPPEPEGLQAGQMARNHPLFHTYTNIENLRNFPDKLNYGEPLVVTEKIHGTNSRIGWVRTQREDGTSELELAIGTHRTQRKTEDPGVYGLPWQKYENQLKNLLDWFCRISDKQVDSLIVFGEIFGAGVQDLHYGAKTEKDWRMFDIALNGEYLNYAALGYAAEEFGLPLVPRLGVGCYSFEQLVEFAQGNTTLADGHIREGCVIRPYLQERSWGRGEFDPNPRRTIFKLIGDDYLLRKGGSEHH